MYLEAAIENIDKMPQSTFDEIIEKYVDLKPMNYKTAKKKSYPPSQPKKYNFITLFAFLA